MQALSRSVLSFTILTSNAEAKRRSHLISTNGGETMFVRTPVKVLAIVLLITVLGLTACAPAADTSRSCAGPD